MKLNSDIDFKRFNSDTVGSFIEEAKKVSDGTLVDGSAENMRLLDQCRSYWDALSDFRTRRKRARMYYRGDQWGEIIEDPDFQGRYITEKQYIQRQGKVPLKQNQIRQIGKNLIGQYRSNPSKPMVVARARENASSTEMMTNALRYTHQLNGTEELDVRCFEEYFLSGAAIQKISYDYWRERNMEDVKMANVNPNRVFFNTDIEDPRHTDLRIIGEVMDVPIEEILGAFAKSKKDEDKIRGWYAIAGSKDVRDYIVDHYGLSPTTLDNLKFYVPDDPTKCRLFEIWVLRSGWRTYVHDYLDASYGISDISTKELDAENERRIKAGISHGMPQEKIPLIEYKRKYESYWYAKYLTPTGQVLWEGESPYAHEEHPYILHLYPLIDGEVWGFVEDIIDQQRYINRLIIMMDFIMSASAKGVLMIPEDAIPDGHTPESFAANWVKFNGVIVYKPSKSGHVPEQVTSNSTVAGISEALALQMRLIQEISGVHSAIQGMTPKSGTPSSLYAQEAQNATLNTLDLMETFTSFKQRRDNKIIKLITQYYNEPRYLAISGKSYDEDAKMFDPSKIVDVDHEVVLTQSADTPTFRNLIDQTLMTLLQGQMIDLEMFLEHTTIPFADKLLESVRKRREQMAAGQQGEIDPEMIAQSQAGADPEAMAMLNQMMPQLRGQAA